MKNKLILILSLCTIVQAYGVGDIELSVLDACTVGVQNLFYSQNAKNEALALAIFRGNYAQVKFWLQNGADLKNACKNKVFRNRLDRNWSNSLLMNTQIDADGQVTLILGGRVYNFEQLEYIVKKYSEVKDIRYNPSLFAGL